MALGPSGDVTVDMGPPQVLGLGEAFAAGEAFRGWRVSVGNPHLACAVDGPVAALDLSRAPGFDTTVFPDGVNVEFYRTLGERHVEMRVYERGSGETRSCGTGTVAVAAAAAVEARDTDDPASLTGEWTVDVPGGRVTVTLGTGTSFLRGPAVLVAEGETCSGWL